MRAFCLIFIVYIFVLLMQPCQEFKTYALEGSRQTVSTVPQNAPDDETQQDGCSPFCVCSCCSMNAVTGQTFAMQIDPQPDLEAVPRVVDRYLNPTTATFQDSIWQPPKA